MVREHCVTVTLGPAVHRFSSKITCGPRWLLTVLPRCLNYWQQEGDGRRVCLAFNGPLLISNILFTSRSKPSHMATPPPQCKGGWELS